MAQVLYFGKEVKPERSFMNRRQIHVMLAKGMGGKTNVGIYKLMFNEYFYVGRSTNIRKRVKQHTKELELMLAKDNPKSNYQRNMLKFLNDNADFSMIKVEILELCAESELKSKEQYWLDEYAKEPNCLNLTFNAKSTWKDKAILEFESGVYTCDFKISRPNQLIELKKLLKNYDVILKLKK